ncbi:MAG TPA: hypothetical protein VGF95_14400 [Solirubrobacteraceae bacterium]|jgi:hypothetical protein
MSEPTVLKTGETYKPLAAVLEDAVVKEPVKNLGEAESIVALIKQGSILIEVDATVSEEATGELSIPLEKVTVTAGPAEMEVRVTWSEGEVSFFPNQGTIPITIEQSLEA